MASAFGTTNVETRRRRGYAEHIMVKIRFLHIRLIVAATAAPARAPAPPDPARLRLGRLVVAASLLLAAVLIAWLA